MTLSSAALLLVPVASVLLFLATLHVVLWLRRRDDRAHFWTAVWLSVAVVFVGVRLLQHTVDTSGAVRLLANLQLVLAAVLSLVLLLLMQALTELPYSRRTLLLVGTWLALSIGAQLVLEVASPSPIISRLDGLDGRYLGIDLARGSPITGVAALVVLVLALMPVARARHLSPHERIAVAVGLVLSAGAAIHDVIILRAGIETVRLLEFGLLAFGLSMSIVLSERYTDLLRALEARVARRTSELSSRNERLHTALQDAERARAESAAKASALARSEAGFRALIEGSPDAIAVERAGTIVFANARCAELLGHAHASDLLGLAPEALVAPSDAPVMAELVEQAWLGARPPPRELRLRRRNGDTLPCEVAMVGLAFDDAHSTIFIARDLTERYAMQGQLVLTDRLASVGSLAVGVAHEINNPLTFVLANAGCLRGELTDHRGSLPPSLASSLTELADEIQIGGERIARIVAQLQSFSRVSSASDDPIDPRRPLEAALLLAENEFRHRAVVVRETGAVPEVAASEARLGQLFLNLLLNAAQAIEEGDRDGHTIRVRTHTSPAGEAVIEISDDGPGIPADALPKIFEPFFTTRAEDQRTGLGLSICHAIVTSLGGNITVQSEAGNGTVARVVLPAASVVAEKAPAPAPESKAGARAKVLIVDDEPFVARALGRTLSGHEIVILSSAREALARLEEDAFDIVFCDLMMPNMTGMDLYEAVRAGPHPEVASRFVFMTGGAFTPRARTFLDETQVPCLEKPFDAQQVRKLVEQFVAANDGAPAKLPVAAAG